MKLFKLLLLLSCFFFVACEEKSSPNYSNNEGQPGESPAPGSPNGSDEENSLKFSNTEVCEWYPSHYHQPNWEDYIEAYGSVVLEDAKGDNRYHLPRIFRDFSSNEMGVSFEEESVSFVSLPMKKYELKKYLPAQIINGCKYPGVKVYKNNEERILFIDEWNTDTFYQAPHIIFSDGALWIDTFYGGRKIPIPLYREKLSAAENIRFIRARYGDFVLKLDNSLLRDQNESLHLTINNRYNAIVASLFIRSKEEEFFGYTGVLRTYRWYNMDGEPMYSLEWRNDGPIYRYDPENKMTKAAAGNVNVNREQIRIVYNGNDSVNEELPFRGEFVLRDTYEWMLFSGAREARAEVIGD